MSWSKNKFPFFAASLLLTLLAFALIPVEWIQNAPRVCAFHFFTGHDCPGCGITRASSHLLHGDFQTALDLNWRIAIVLPVLFFVAVNDVRMKQRP